jgi:Tfp pilus assembly protein PilF
MWEDMLRKKTKIEYPTQYILLGQSYLLKSNFKKAIKSYQKALRIDPNRPKAQLFLANAWLKKAVNKTNAPKREKKKCLHKALVHYNKAEKLSPNSIIGEWARRKLKKVVDNIKPLSDI